MFWKLKFLKASLLIALYHVQKLFCKHALAIWNNTIKQLLPPNGVRTGSVAFVKAPLSPNEAHERSPRTKHVTNKPSFQNSWPQHWVHTSPTASPPIHVRPNQPWTNTTPNPKTPWPPSEWDDGGGVGQHRESTNRKLKDGTKPYENEALTNKPSTLQNLTQHLLSTRSRATAVTSNSKSPPKNQWQQPTKTHQQSRQPSEWDTEVPLFSTNRFDTKLSVIINNHLTDYRTQKAVVSHEVHWQARSTLTKATLEIARRT